MMIMHCTDLMGVLHASTAVLMHKNNSYWMMTTIVFDENLAYVCDNLVKYVTHLILIQETTAKSPFLNEEIDP